MTWEFLLLGLVALAAGLVLTRSDTRGMVLRPVPVPVRRRRGRR